MERPRLGEQGAIHTGNPSSGSGNQTRKPVDRRPWPRSAAARSRGCSAREEWWTTWLAQSRRLSATGAAEPADADAVGEEQQHPDPPASPRSAASGASVVDGRRRWPATTSFQRTVIIVALPRPMVRRRARCRACRSRCSRARPRCRGVGTRGTRRRAAGRRTDVVEDLGHDVTPQGSSARAVHAHGRARCRRRPRRPRGRARGWRARRSARRRRPRGRPTRSAGRRQVS